MGAVQAAGGGLDFSVGWSKGPVFQGTLTLGAGKAYPTSTGHGGSVTVTTVTPIYGS